jgi:hypothetical protein
MGKSEKQANKQTTLKVTTKPKKQYSEKMNFIQELKQEGLHLHAKGT